MEKVLMLITQIVIGISFIYAGRICIKNRNIPAFSYNILFLYNAFRSKWAIFIGCLVILFGIFFLVLSLLDLLHALKLF